MVPGDKGSTTGCGAGALGGAGAGTGDAGAGELGDVDGAAARAVVTLSIRGDAPPVPTAVTELMCRAVTAAVTAYAPSGHWLVDLTVAGDQWLAQLNAAYRERAETTDVLSFPQWSPGEWPNWDPHDIKQGPLPLGDVVVNLAAAARAAALYGHSLARECTFLAVHGTLHLLGYDHEEEKAAAAMENCTEAVLCPMGLQRGR